MIKRRQNDNSGFCLDPAIFKVSCSGSFQKVCAKMHSSLQPLLESQVACLQLEITVDASVLSLVT